VCDEGREIVEDLYTDSDRADEELAELLPQVTSVPFLRAVGNANYRDDCHTGFDTAKPRGY
jgi:hypothetical protein